MLTWRRGIGPLLTRLAAAVVLGEDGQLVVGGEDPADRVVMQRPATAVARQALVHLPSIGPVDRRSLALRVGPPPFVRDPAGRLQVLNCGSGGDTLLALNAQMGDQKGVSGFVDTEGERPVRPRHD